MQKRCLRLVDTMVLDSLITVSRQEIMKALSLIRDGGLNAKIFPTPPDLFLGCSLSIAISSGDLCASVSLLKEADIEVLLTNHCDENPVRSFYGKTWH